MPIISKIGRKQTKIRLLILAVYAVLILGSVTMVYPFLLMLAGSTKSGVDTRDFVPVPRFLYDEKVLYQKYIEAMFNETLLNIQVCYGTDIISFEYLETPERPNRLLVAEWERFLKESNLPHYADTCGFAYAGISRKTSPWLMWKFRGKLKKRFDDDLDALNRAYDTEFIDWNTFNINACATYTDRTDTIRLTRFYRDFWEFKASIPHYYKHLLSVEDCYKKLTLQSMYGEDIEGYNSTHGTQYASYDDIHLPRRYPTNGTEQEKQDWEDYARMTITLLWLRVDPEAAPFYHEFLKAKYGSIGALNSRYGTTYAGFDEIPLIEEIPFEGIVMRDWDSFITGWEDLDTGRVYKVPIEMVYLMPVDFQFQDYMKARYGTIAAINEKFSTSYQGFQDVLTPQKDYHYIHFLENKDFWRWEFVLRNYRAAWDYLVVHGRGVLNTVIYCSAAVLFALLVNPMAAYAMSRYRMPTSYKILLFMMLTMAFPPMVTMIPAFLMLREMRMLNTFAALILPGLANGYWIFLLKGFFDSLPQELYESASLDGAGEWTMFWGITMALSKPILAVIALGAFTTAYINFMFALLICQDQKMWTLMVWLYQLQQTAGTGVIYASLLIAAIPTLLLFIFCQRIIIRGIVVPVEK